MKLPSVLPDDLVAGLDEESPMNLEYSGHFVGGGWFAPRVPDLLDVHNPADGARVGSVVAGTAEDVDVAVTCARDAFVSWSSSSRRDRRDVLMGIADLVEARAEEFAAVISAEMGAPRDNAYQVQTMLPVQILRTHAELVHSFEFDQYVGHSLVTKDAIGVVGAVTPWNYPLYQICTKLAPALSAGCTLVLKPSEVAPFNALMLAEIATVAGLPAGVFNVVTGSGAVAGEALVRHPAVDMVSFTGSTAVGRRITELAAPSVKRVALELGGKSASLVLPSADLETAVRASVANVLYNTGQTCTAWTRLLVDDERYDDAVAIAADEVRGQLLGDPREAGTHLGPVATPEQHLKVQAMIELGIAEGARLVVGGPGLPEGLADGLYVRPTLFADVTNDMTIAREEIFGPVLCVMRYRTVEEAISIANDSDYGLAGAVWAATDDEALTVARRLRTGRVDLNGAAFNPLAPTGGFKQSGNGRELGVHGIQEFCELKAVQFPRAATREAPTHPGRSSVVEPLPTHTTATGGTP